MPAMSDFYFSSLDAAFDAPPAEAPFKLEPKRLIEDAYVLERGGLDLMTALLQTNRGIMVAGVESDQLAARFLMDAMPTLSAMGVRQLYGFMVPRDRQHVIDRFIADNEDDLGLRMQLDKFYPQTASLPKQYLDLIKAAVQHRMEVIAAAPCWLDDRAEDGTPTWVPFIHDRIALLRPYDRFLILGNMGTLVDCFMAPGGDLREGIPTLGLQSGTPRVTRNNDENGDYLVELGFTAGGDGGGRSFKQTKAQRLGPNASKGGKGM